MPTRKLTDTGIKKLSPPTKGQVTYWDSELKGFGLRVGEKGTKAFIAMPSVKTGERWQAVRITIGRYPALGLAEAREEARRFINAAKKGIHPRELQVEESRTKERERMNTFAACREKFLNTYCTVNLRDSTKAEYKRVLEKEFGGWDKFAVTSITKRDVKNILDDKAAKNPYMANRMRAYLHKFFQWCMDSDLIDSNPAKIERPLKNEEKRDRFLTEEEIRDFWLACDAETGFFGYFGKLLLVTGQREKEISTMRWQDIDFDNALWTLPKESTKAKRKHIVPLSPLALEILRAVPKHDDRADENAPANRQILLTGKCEYVFSNTGKTPISGFSIFKRRLDRVIAAARKEQERQDIPAWRFHDLRRTAATGMQKIGIAPHVISKILNHSYGSGNPVTAIYARHDYADEKRQALNAWASYLESLVTQQKKGNVIALSSGRINSHA